MPLTQVHVVDDEARVRRSLERLLRTGGLDVISHSTPAAFLAAAGSVGCALLDYRMPELSGLEVQEVLASRGAHWQIVFLTGHADIAKSVQAMKGGAVDFLVKPATGEQILGALRGALARHEQVCAALAEREEVERRLAELSPREWQVMSHVIAGDRNKVTADALGTAEKTVKIQRAQVMHKMGARSVAELVRLADKADVASRAPPQKTARAVDPVEAQLPVSLRSR